MTEVHNDVSPLADLVRASRLPSPAERKRIRRAAGVSLERMAEDLGVSHVSVSFWERGVYDPSMENAAKYRKLLGELAEASGTEIAEAP